jgi:hypothetical protein
LVRTTYRITGIQIGDGNWTGRSHQEKGNKDLMTLTLVPVNYKTACEFIDKYHRHHLHPQGWKFGIAVNDGDKLVGVVTVGRPVSRNLDNGLTLEVTRNCTDGTKNTVSMLYGAAWRATKALGYKRLITYTLITESGVSLRASGWKDVYITDGGSWSCPSRPRINKTITCPKILWEKT